MGGGRHKHHPGSGYSGYNVLNSNTTSAVKTAKGTTAAEPKAEKPAFKVTKVTSSAQLANYKNNKDFCQEALTFTPRNQPLLHLNHPAVQEYLTAVWAKQSAAAVRKTKSQKPHL
jgi:hypothetical protein